MSIVQTTLIFVGIPAAATLIVVGLVYARSAERTPRYRPGGPWQYEPVWYLPHPEHSGPVSSMHRPELQGGELHGGELESGGLHGGEPHGAGLRSDGARQAITGRVAEPATASGGASGEW
ncbi:MAG: hypothetical protein ABIQ09_17840 [Jatrophihabitantaceae bacterium]